MSRSRMIQILDVDQWRDTEDAPLLEFAAQLAKAEPLLEGMEGAQALRAALLAVILQALVSAESSGRLPLALEKVGGGLDIIVRVGDPDRDGDSGGDEQGGARVVSGENRPASAFLGVMADGHDELAQGLAVSVGKVTVSGVGDQQSGHDDSSSVGGDGATGGDPAPSGSGVTQPTEEDSPSDAAYYLIQVLSRAMRWL